MKTKSLCAGFLFIMSMAFLSSCGDSDSVSNSSDDVSSFEKEDSALDSDNVEKTESSSSAKRLSSTSEKSSSSKEKNSSSSIKSQSSKNSSSSEKSSSSKERKSSSSSKSKSSSSSKKTNSKSEDLSSSSVASSAGVALKCGDKTYNPDNQLCDDRDNRIYKYVTIAPENSGYSKSWMAENLRYATVEGSFCEGVLSEEGDKSFNCDKYGRLYTWTAAVGKSVSECGDEKECNLGSESVQGICPSGWHLPSADEWRELVVAVDEKITNYSYNNNAALQLKSKSGWFPVSDRNANNGLDSYGFSALAAGDWDCHGDGYYDDEGYDAFFWTSTEFSRGLRAYYVSLYNELDDEGNDAVIVESSSKRYGFSVRCVKDEE